MAVETKEKRGITVDSNCVSLFEAIKLLANHSTEKLFDCHIEEALIRGLQVMLPSGPIVFKPLKVKTKLSSTTLNCCSLIDLEYF